MITSRFLKLHALASSILLALLITEVLSKPAPASGSIEEPLRNAKFDEITVNHINVLDAEGRTRVTLAGGYPPRRGDLAGLLFHNEEGNEAGGLVYYGRRESDGQVNAGGILTFDQFQEDQVMTVEYAHHGDRKRNGIKIIDRPDTMSERVKQLYIAVESAKTDEEREAIKNKMLPTIPPEELAAKRLYVGRNSEGASVVELCDGAGKPRITLRVNKDGEGSISFLDANGKVARTLTP